MKQPVISARHLTKSFGGKEVIHDCSLSVEQGSLYGVLGRNGAGKTTLFKLLLGLQHPTAGSSSVMGLDSVQDCGAVLRRTGSLIETPVFYEHLSAVENLRLHLAYMEKLYDEAKQDYTEAQQKYAQFADANLNISRLVYRAEQERLQNEMNLAYQMYTTVSQQLQMAKAKVQEITPVYTVVQPATVPLRAAKPNKLMILVGFVFLAGVGSVGWILFVKDFIRNWKKSEAVAQPEPETV